MLGTKLAGCAKAARAFLFLLLLAPAAAATDVPAQTISGSTTWTTAGSPYVLLGNVTVANGGSLTIQAGVDVRFNGNFALTIGGTVVSSPGTLTAAGTAGSPITFQFNGTPGAGKWQYVRFQAGATASSSMSHCIVKHAGSSTGAIVCITGSPSLSNITVQDSGTDAIYLTSASPALSGALSLTGAGGYLIRATNTTAVPTFSGVTLSSSNLLGVAHPPFWSSFFASGPALTGGSYRAEVNVGTLTASATWGGVANLASIDLLGDLTIQAASSPVLTIAAGTTVRLPANGDVLVGNTTSTPPGDLVVAGTALAPVRFERSGATAWGYVHFRAGSTSASSVSHCVLTGGGASVGTIYCLTAEPTLSDVTVENTTNDAIHLNNSSPHISGAISLTGTGSLYLIRATSTASHPTFSGVTLASTQKLAVGGAVMWSNFFGSGPTLSGGPYRADVWTDTVVEDGTWGGVANLASIDLLGDLSILAAASPVLTIAAGTTVRLPANGNILVGNTTSTPPGDLVVAGTAQAPVRFERSGATAWGYVLFRAGSTSASSVSHCVLTGGGASVGTIYCLTAEPTLSNVTVENTSNDAIHLNNSSPHISGAIGLTGTGSFYLIRATSTASHPTFSGVTLSSTQKLAVGGAVMWSTFFASGPSIAGGPSRAEVLADTLTASATWGGVANLASIDMQGTFTVAHASSPVLTIAPGTVLRFPNVDLDIGGTTLPGALDARGTAVAPILFTTTSATPAAGQWQGINIANTASTSYLEHCTVEYAGGGSNGGNVRIANARTFVRYCTFRFGSQAGVRIASGAPTLEFNAFTNNLFGIDVLAAAQPRVVRNNLFDGNTTNGVRSTSTAGFSVQLNAWGDASGPSGSGPGSGDSISGNVLFEPWLESAAAPGFQWVQAAQSPDPFTPAGGATDFSAAWSDDADWTLEIRDSSAALVRSFSGTGALLDQTWEGDDDSGGPGQPGAPLPDGQYTYALAATSAGSFQPVPTARGVVTLDDSLPIARITAPDPDDLVAGIVTVEGTASGGDFDSYRLEYKSGVAPAGGSWVTIATSSTPVTSGVLGNWNTAGLTAPFYTLRLTVETNGPETAEDQVLLRMLSIAGFASAPGFISPNGDAVQESTALSATLTWPADWTLTVSAPGGGPAVRTFTGSGEQVAQVWDGKDESAVVVADGDYDLLVQAVEPGDTTTASAGSLVVVDNTPPVTLIASPTAQQTVLSSYPFQIEGTAADDNLVTYVLRIAPGAPPGTFTTLKTSATPVTGVPPDDNLYLLSSLLYAPGVYTLRLSASDDAGNASSIDRAFTLDYISITNVNNAPEVIEPELGQTVEVSFTVSHDCDVSIDFHQWPGGELVKTVTENGLLAGPNELLWDGLDAFGMFSTPDVLHYFVVRATDALGRDGHFNELGNPKLGVGASWGATNIVTTGFDPYANDEIRVEYNVNGWLSSQITVQGGALNVPLSPTGAFYPGAHVDFWDGRNQFGDIHQGFFQFYFGVPDDLPDPAVFLKRGPILFEEFRAQAYLIHPVLGQVSGLEYELTRDANVTIAIEDPNGNHVRTILPEVFQGAGAYDLDEGLGWDGRDDSGDVVSGEGTYSIVLSAVDLLTGKVYVRRGAVTVNR